MPKCVLDDENESLTPNAVRCRRYRRRKALRLCTGDAQPKAQSKNAMYCKRYRLKKKMLDTVHTEGDNVTTPVPETDDAVNTSSSTTAPDALSKNALHCRGYKEKKKQRNHGRIQPFILPRATFQDLKGPESRMELEQTAVLSQMLPGNAYSIALITDGRLLKQGQVLQGSCALLSVENETSSSHGIPVEEQEIPIKQDLCENLEQAEDPLSLDIQHPVVVKTEDEDGEEQEPCDEAGPAAFDTIFVNDFASDAPEAASNNINHAKIKLEEGHTLSPELPKYFGPGTLVLPRRGRPPKEKKKKFEDFSREDMQDPRRAVEFYDLATYLMQRNKLLHENILFSARIDKLESEIEHMKRRIVDCDNNRCHRWR